MHSVDLSDALLIHDDEFNLNDDSPLPLPNTNALC